MAAAMAFYPGDNFLTIILALIARATNQLHPWHDITAYLLGPNLNIVLRLIEPDHRSRPAFAAPLVSIDGNHALAVIGGFALAFAAIAVVRSVQPDVLE